MRKRVLLTAGVLFPRAIWVLVLRLGVIGMIEPYWTSSVLAEWRRNILREHPDLDDSKLDQLVSWMRDMFPEADILDYEDELAQIPRRLNDRDLLAAAVATGVDAIVAADLRRFGPEFYGYAGIAVLTPDKLLCQCLDEDQELVVQLLDEEGVQQGVTCIDVSVALYPQAPQFAEEVVRIFLPGTSRSQREAIMRRETSEERPSDPEE